MKLALNSFSWQALTLGSVVLNTFGAALSKYQVDRASAFQVLIYKYIASSLLLTSIWIASGASWPKLWPVLFVYGLVGGVNVAAYTAATRHSLSLTVATTPIKRLGGIFWSGIFLGELVLFDITKPSGRLMMLALLLMGLVFWLFYEKREGVVRWNKLIWFHLLFGSFVSVIAKFFTGFVEPATLLVFQYWGSLTSAVLVAKYRSHRLYLGKRFALRGLLHGSINSLGILLWFTALAMSTVTQVTLLREPLIVVLIALIGLYGYKERNKVTARKILGMAMAVILLGVVLSIKS